MYVNGQLLLDDNYYENNVPTDKDIYDFAVLIGIDVDTEPELVWLAKRGLMSRLPPGWKLCQNESGDTYYHDFSTGVSTWVPPCTPDYQRLVDEHRKDFLPAAEGLTGTDKEKNKDEAPAEDERGLQDFVESGNLVVRAVEDPQPSPHPGSSNSRSSCRQEPEAPSPNWHSDFEESPHSSASEELQRSHTTSQNALSTAKSNGFPKTSDGGASDSSEAEEVEEEIPEELNCCSISDGEESYPELLLDVTAKEADGDHNRKSCESPPEPRLQANENEEKGEVFLHAVDKESDSFLDEAIKRFRLAKKAELQKTEVSNQLSEQLVGENVEGERCTSSVGQEEQQPSSAELCNTPEDRKADRAVEEERECMKREKEKRIHFLQQELRREEEEKKLREERDERLRALRQKLQSKKTDKECRLKEKSEEMLREHRESAQREQELQQHKIREESEAMTAELRVALQKEHAAERDRLVAQRKQDSERLKAEFDKELQGERRRLQEDMEEKLISLKQEEEMKTVIEVEEERECLRREKEERVHLLRQELRMKEEEEEKKLKEERDDRLSALSQNLQAKRRDEESKLKDESDEMLMELRESAQREQELQQHKIREESEAMTAELRVALQKEHAAERDRLVAQKKQASERLKAEFDKELQAERRRLQEDMEEKLISLKQEVKSRERELMNSPPEHDFAGSNPQLADVLQEVQEEVLLELARKVEQQQEAHEKELNRIRQRYLDEEAAQQKQHAAERKKLQLQLKEQIKTHTEKTLSRLIQERDQLKQDLEREEQKNAQSRGFYQRLKGEIEAKQEERLKEETDKVKEEIRMMKEENEQLKSTMALLHEKYERLSCTVSELDQKYRLQPEQKEKREAAAQTTPPSSAEEHSSLSVEELSDQGSVSTDIDDSILSNLHQCVSSPAASIGKTKTCWMVETQPAQVNSSFEPIRKMDSLQQVAQRLRELSMSVMEETPLLQSSAVDPLDGAGQGTEVAKVSAQRSPSKTKRAAPIKAASPPLRQPLSTHAPSAKPRTSPPATPSQNRTPPRSSVTASRFPTPTPTITSMLRASKHLNNQSDRVSPESAVDPVSSKTLRRSPPSSAYTPARRQSLQRPQAPCWQKMQETIKRTRAWMEQQDKKH